MILNVYVNEILCLFGISYNEWEILFYRSRNEYHTRSQMCFFRGKIIKEVSEYLNETNGKIYNRSYEKILEKCKEGDFVFLDPPYVEDHNYGFNYNKVEIHL